MFITDYLADRDRFLTAAHELEKYAPARDYREHQEKLTVARAILEQPDLKPENVNLEAAFITAASELKKHYGKYYEFWLSVESKGHAHGRSARFTDAAYVQATTAIVTGLCQGGQQVPTPAPLAPVEETARANAAATRAKMWQEFLKAAHVHPSTSDKRPLQLVKTHTPEGAPHG